LELGVRSQEPGEKRKKEEVRSQKKCFYKYEMLPNPVCAIAPHFSFNCDRLLFKGTIPNNSTLSPFKLSPLVVL
jgi:hypothetical protein